MRSTPAHKQTDPAKAPGQIVNRNEDMMDDMALYAFMNRPRDTTVGEYARRKTDLPTHATSAEEKQAILDGAAFKPCRDLPQGWDHV